MLSATNDKSERKSLQGGGTVLNLLNNSLFNTCYSNYIILQVKYSLTMILFKVIIYVM